MHTVHRGFSSQNVSLFLIQISRIQTSVEVQLQIKQTLNLLQVILERFGFNNKTMDAWTDGHDM